MTFILRTQRLHSAFRRVSCVLLFSVTTSALLFGQKPDIIAGSLQYPRNFEPGKIRMSLELSLARAPEDILLEFSQLRAPLFSFDVYYGLPQNFLLEGKWTTVIFFTNQIAIGAKWTHEWDRLHMSVGDDIAYMFGHLDQGAVKTFDNRMKGWMNYPNISVGYAFNSFALTLKGELSVITSITATSDNIELSSDKNIFNGGSVAL